MDAQASLFNDIAERKLLERHPGDARTIRERFERFHQLNPDIYRLFSRIALNYARKGTKRISAKGIFERIRYEMDPVNGSNFYQLNNDFTPYYSRLFIANHPDYKRLFQTRMIKTG